MEAGDGDVNRRMDTRFEDVRKGTDQLWSNTETAASFFLASTLTPGMPDERKTMIGR